MFRLWKLISLVLFLLVMVQYANAINGVNQVHLNAEVFQNKNSSATSSLVVSLRQTFNDVEELIENIIQSFTTYVPQITSDMKELLNKMANRMSNALEEFNNKLLDAGESLLRDIVRNMQRQLHQMKDEFQSLAYMADEQFNRVVDHFNNTLMNQSENIDAWAANLKQELRTVNDSRLYKEGCEFVDDFIQETTNELRHCCNIAVKPVHSLCLNVRAVLAEAFHALADAMDRMQICLEDKKSYMKYMVPCINVAYDDVNALIARAEQLRHNLTTMLPMKIMFSKFCISMVSVQMEQRQYKIEQVLEAKIRLKNRL